MAFTEFYCNASTGSNMNGGSDENTSPAYSATNGGWNSGTGVFTPTSGDPSAVSPTLVGQFASVFTDGATTPVFVARVTAVSSTTVTVSTTAKSGTAPTTGASGLSINVGGVWLGPNAAVSFPFAFVQATMTNASSEKPRVNLKNNATYSVTAGFNVGAASSNDGLRFSGYSSAVSDGGRAVIDGGTSGASYVIMTINRQATITDFEILNNGATGTQYGVVYSSGASLQSIIKNLVIHDVRGSGIRVASGAHVEMIECEFYSCNQSNDGSNGGIQNGGCPVRMTRCVSHDNSQFGLIASGAGVTVLDNCIIESNASSGVKLNTYGVVSAINSDFYNNGSHGIDSASGTLVNIENCNFIKNGGYGVNAANGNIGNIRNCGFGAGTQANSSGTTNAVGSIDVSGSVTYANDVTPWTDPANGDFRIDLAAAQGTGRGAYTQTAASYAGTVGYPDIGAAQHQDSGGGGGAFAVIGRNSPTIRGKF